MTIRELLAEGTKRLRSPEGEMRARIDTPALDAALLLCEIFSARREELIIRGNESAARSKREQFFGLLERRLAGECVAYILGRKEFRGLEFAVNPDVLVPRPDTETLVEAALVYIDAMNAVPREGGISLLDLCTGSGALAVSLKNERPFLEVSASDISARALETARLNAVRLLGTPGETPPERAPVRFIQSDLFENIQEKFDIILSNPPYIPSCHIGSLAPEIQKEPVLALDGGADGLFLIKKIVLGAPDRLATGGALLFEASPEQMPTIHSLLEKAGFTGIHVKCGLEGSGRVISGSVETGLSYH